MEIINKFLGILCLLFVINKAFSQSGTNIILGGKPVNQISFYHYQTENKLMAVYKDTNDAKNLCPEGLMRSILSCSNQEWEDYNTWGGAINSDKRTKAYYANIKAMNKEKNYMQLIYRLDYIEDSIPFSIIKFYLHSERTDRLRVGVMIMKKIDYRWYKTNFYNSLNTSIMMIRIKSEILEQIFSNTIIDDAIRSFFKDIYNNNNIVDLTKLSQRFNELYDSENKEFQKLIVDENAW
jgi:hypothetical protein